MPAVPRKTFDAVHGVAEAHLCNRSLSRIGAELIADTEEQTKQARICRELYASVRDEVLRTGLFNFAVRNSLIYEYEDYPHETDGHQYAFRANFMLSFTGTNNTSASITGTSVTMYESYIGFEVIGDHVPAGARIIGVTGDSITLDRATTGIAANLYIKIPMLKILNIMADSTVQYQVIGPFDDRVILSDVYYGENGGNIYIDMKYIHQVIDPDEFDPLFQEALVLRLAAKIAPAMTTSPQLSAILNNEYVAILRQAEKSSSEERQVDEADEWWTDRRGL